MSRNPGTASPAPPRSMALIGTLGGIAIMSGLLVATTFQLTRERILQNRREALERAVFEVLPEATNRRSFFLNEEGLQALADDALGQASLYAGYDDSGALTGVAIEGSARGYQDVVKVLYGYSLERECITGMTVLQSSETPGLGDRVETDPAFQANFECLDARLNSESTALVQEIVTVKHGKKTDSWQIDAISGATVTSAAVGRALQQSASEILPLLHRYEAALYENTAEERTSP